MRRKAVDVFDLPTIVDLYYAQNEIVRSIETEYIDRPLLTTDFGIPIFAYMLDDKIIAYTMVFSNELMKKEYKLVADEQYQGYIGKEELLAYAKKYYDEYGIDSIHLKNAIESFVDWLNWAEKNRG